MLNSVHLILQGKGGIGKSLTAVLLAQYFISKGETLKAFDTDQENTTFSHYKALNAQHIPVMNESRTINAKMFDTLIENILEQEGVFVIDNGANTFSPLLAYMVENDLVNFLQESGRKVYVHTIVGGGDTLQDTANGFNSIAQGLPEASIVLWMNEHFGKLESAEGKPFLETKLFKSHQERLHGTVLLPARNHHTYGDDIKRMNVQRLTLDEVKVSANFVTMEKQRIYTVVKDVFAQLDRIAF
jgi:FMN-dependent NADH-azoreductase